MTDEAKALVEQCKGHTPGPWAANSFIAQVDSGQLDGSNLIPIAQLLWPTELRSEAETQANARLIAAAPEMLDLIETQASENERLREALTQIARLRTDLRGDFSLGSKQSDIARAALAGDSHAA